VDQQFKESFEKEAGLKHLALAGSLALSPVAKAGDDAVKHGLRAIKKTEMGQQVTKKLKSYEDKVKDYVKFRPDIPEGPVVRGSSASQQGSASAASAVTPKISLKDLGTAQLKYKDLTATASPSGVKARYNVNNNTFVEGFKRGNDSGIRVGYNKSF
jgi:hypothetical protein